VATRWCPEISLNPSLEKREVRGGDPDNLYDIYFQQTPALARIPGHKCSESRASTRLYFPIRSQYGGSPNVLFTKSMNSRTFAGRNRRSG
jgi:hypothetical protein